MGKKVLVVGSGGREHALAWKLAQSPQVDKIFVAPGNGGTANIVQNVDIKFTDTTTLLNFAISKKIDLVVIGQEAASEAGVVDALIDAGLTVFGPTKAAVRIESSKAFSKDLMRDQNIPTANFKNFNDPTKALIYIENHTLPFVIKASGLAEGKGAVVCTSLAQARKTINEIMVKKIFKNAGDIVVIEDFLSGQEISTHALCDGNQAVLFPPSQDHKQVYDGDIGPNTGGMGVIAPVPWVTDAQMDIVRNKIIEPALKGLSDAGSPFKGCIYPGLMIDDKKVNVIEFNARFGDPEAQVYMRLLDADLFEVLTGCANGQLDPSKIKWGGGAAISVALCSGGYPGPYQKGLQITGIEQAEKLEDVVVFQAGTKMINDQLVTNGGRVLHVTATGSSIDDARTKVYKAIKLISFEGMHYRTDIGNRN